MVSLFFLSKRYIYIYESGSEICRGVIDIYYVIINRSRLIGYVCFMGFVFFFVILGVFMYFFFEKVNDMFGR